MSDSNLLMKVVLFLGICMLFVQLAYPGAGASWNGLVTTLQTGPNFPIFPQYSGNILYNASAPFFGDMGGSIVSVDNGSFSSGSIGCSPTSLFNCLNNGPYSGNITFNHAFSESLSTLNNAAGSVGIISFNVFCQNLAGYGPGTGLYINISLPGAGTNFLTTSQTPICFPGGFLQTVWALNVNSSAIPVQWFNGAFVSIDTYGPIGHVHDNTKISFFQIKIFAQGTAPSPKCGYLDVACAISGAWNIATRPLFWLGQVAIYIGQLIFSAVSFGFNLISGVFIGIISSLIFLLALPGAPLIVQAIVDVLVLPEIVLLLYIIGTFIVGFIGGVVNKA